MTLEAGIICGGCDWLNPLELSACEDCGQDLSLQLSDKPEGDEASESKGDKEKPMEQARHFICSSCYSPVPTGHKFCGKCGTSVDEAVQEAPQYFGDMQAPGKAKLILIKGEGMDGISYHLNSVEHLAGRSEGAILFTEDKWLSPKHANFFYADDKLKVRDEESVNGVFCYVEGTVDVPSGMIFMAGEQVFRVETVTASEDAPEDDGTYYFASPQRDASFRVVQILEGGGDGMVVHAKDDTLVIGREDCDMNFPNDPYLSGSHLKLELKGTALKLSDLESKNGTFVQIEDEKELSHGNYIFLGRQLLRVEITS